MEEAKGSPQAIPEMEIGDAIVEDQTAHTNAPSDGGDAEEKAPSGQEPDGNSLVEIVPGGGDGKKAPSSSFTPVT